MKKKLLSSLMLLSLSYMVLGNNDYKQDSYYQSLNGIEKLNYAIEQADVLTITTLLTQVDVNNVDDRGDTPLHNAIPDGSLEIIKLLVTSGANINAKNKYGYTPLYEVLISLFEGIAMIAADNMGPLLMNQYGQEYISMARYLINTGADITLKYNISTDWGLLIQNNKDLTIFDMITSLKISLAQLLTNENYQSESEKQALQILLKYVREFEIILLHA